MDERLRNVVLIGFLAGAVAALAYLIPYASLGLPIVIAILLYLLRTWTWKINSFFIFGFVFATVYEFLILSWAWNTSFYLSSPGIGVPFVGALALIFFTLALLSLVAGITFLPWIYVSVKVRTAPVFDVLILAGVWVACEWFRILLLSVLSYGDGVLNPPYLSFGMIGYSLADYGGMLPLAHYGGIYSLSFFLALLGGVLFYGYRAVKNENIRTVVLGMAGIVFFVVVGSTWAHGHEVSGKESVPITLVTKYSYPAAPSYGDEVAPAQEQATLVVLPEGSREFFPLELVPASSLHAGSAVIDSYPKGQYFQNEKSIPGAYMVTAATTTLVREKHALAPYGEFTPLAMNILARLTGFAKTLEQFTRQRHYTQGSYESAFTFENARGSIIFCDEIAVPGIANGIVKKTGANIILAVASTHWFPKGYMLHRETIRMAKVRAVEAGVPLARSAYGDPAFVVDASGNLVYEGSWEDSSIKTIQVPLP